MIDGAGADSIKTMSAVNISTMKLDFVYILSIFTSIIVCELRTRKEIMKKMTIKIDIKNLIRHIELEMSEPCVKVLQ